MQYVVVCEKEKSFALYFNTKIYVNIIKYKNLFLHLTSFIFKPIGPDI